MSSYDSEAQELVRMLDRGLGGLGARLLIRDGAESVSFVPQNQGVEGAYFFD